MSFELLNTRILEQIEIGLIEADDPTAEWVSNEELKASWAKKRNELLKRAEGGAPLITHRGAPVSTSRK